MTASGGKLLVTTALEETWGREEDLVFLGEWCKRYDRRNVWSQRVHETVTFHWNDRQKLKRDYTYLESLHGVLLRSLAASLNDFHKVDHSVRYWQILVDPWLLSYLAVSFDRWESLRSAVETHREFEYVARDGLEGLLTPFSYTEFLSSAFSDHWNQAFYQRIIESEAPSIYSCSARISGAPDGTATEPEAAPLQRRSMLGRMLAGVDRFLGNAAPKNDVALLGSTFSLRALIRLSLALGQAPRLYLAEFGAPLRERDWQALNIGRPDPRARLRLAFQAGSPFELFVKRWIVDDLPRCLVEHYPAMRARAKEVAVRTKVIVTGSSHWGDAYAKVWFAEQVHQGAKLVVTEHGGSLPPFRELFDFEVDIADAKATWFLPYHRKDTQLPPARIVGRFIKSRSPFFGPKGQLYCSVIGNECARWVHRVHFYPMAHQWLDSFNMVCRFQEMLDIEIKGLFRFKPHHGGDHGWITRQRLSDTLGQGKTYSDQPIDRVFAASKVIVCTYPETTFAEAMASGAPTILMYAAHLYELNPVALPLLEILRSAGIVYTDAASAAAHLNAIWADPDQWWNSDTVRHARAEFRRQALDLDGDWVGKWKTFLNRLAA